MLARLMTVAACLIMLSGSAWAAEPSLSNPTLTVTLAADAPRIVSITHKPTGVTLDGPGPWKADWAIDLPGGSVKLSQTTVTVKTTDTVARYTIDTRRDVKFDIAITLADDELRMAVENVQGDLQRIDFGQEPLIAVSSATGPWQLAATYDMMYGGLLSDALSVKTPSVKEADWVVLSNGKLAVSLQNNIPRSPNLIRQNADRCSLGSNVWQYAVKGGHHLPLYQVALGVVGDLNGDKTADWQDGCLFLQRHVPGELPEMIHTMLLGWVGLEDADGNGMNATFPQVGDIIRRTYNITAGEPLAMGLAGWCYWGWDSEYPAADEASRRAGGTKALVELNKEAWRYGSQVSLCINFDDAYMQSPGWDLNIMCTNPDGTPQKYMYWAGGMAYHICPWKDVTTGSAFKRIETMLDYGTAGSCYIDVLSANIDKESAGPGGFISKLDNLWAKFQIAEYYWSHGVKLYSEHCKYPFVGRILGGLNNKDTGLSTEQQKVPMPSFILHGKMNNFFSSTAFGRGGQLLLGIEPNIDGNVFSPTDTHLDAIFLQALPARAFIAEKMRSFTFDGKQFRAEYTGNTVVTMNAQGKNLSVTAHGRKIADDTTSFVPRKQGGFWAYSTQTTRMSYPLPDGWDANKIRVFALNRDGRHEQVLGAHAVANGQLTLRVFPRVPYLVTNGEDLVPVASQEYGRFSRTVTMTADTWDGRAILADRNRQLGENRVVIDQGTIALPPAGDGAYTAAAIGKNDIWVARRFAKDSAVYRDKRLRPKDAVLRVDSQGAVKQEIPVLGPVNDIAYDAKRDQVIVTTGAFNCDGVQFIDAQAGKVVGFVPLVSEAWGENMLLAVSGDVVYVAAPETGNVAAIALNVPWPAQAAQWCDRIFQKGADPRDPEAALDEFLRVRWDRLRDFHNLGIAPLEIHPGPEGGFIVRACQAKGSPIVHLFVAPAAGAWKPEAKNGQTAEPFDRLKRALSLPREQIVATNLPGNAQPWWLTLPKEKHNIVPEPQPIGAMLFVSVSPRYPTVEKAKEHAALITSLRCRNWIRSKTTMPLVDLGTRQSVVRENLRKPFDFWELGYMYAVDLMTAQWVQSLPDNEWYVETLKMPNGQTLYRAGLLSRVPTAEFQRVYEAALAGEAQWYADAAAKETDAAKKKELLGFSDLFKAAPKETKVDWLSGGK